MKFAPFGGEPDKVEVWRLVVPFVEDFHVSLARCAQRNDALAVRRPGDVAVVRGRDGELLGRALSVGTYFPNLAAGFVPGDIRDPLTVRRPCRLELTRTTGGETVWRARGKVHAVKVCQSG